MSFSGALNLAWFSEILMRMAKPHPGMENIGVSEMEEMLMKEFSQVNQSAVSIKETSSEIKFCEIMTNFRSQGHYSPAVWGSVSLVYNDFCRMENSLELTHCVHMFQYWPSAAVLWVWCFIACFSLFWVLFEMPPLPLVLQSRRTAVLMGLWVMPWVLHLLPLPGGYFWIKGRRSLWEGVKADICCGSVPCRAGQPRICAASREKCLGHNSKKGMSCIQNWRLS